MNVYLSTDQLGDPIWTRNGNQGDVWNLAKIEIDSSPIERYLVIEGVVGSGFKGDQVCNNLYFKKNKNLKN